MKPGDPVRQLPKYTLETDPTCGIIIEKLDLLGVTQLVEESKRTYKFNVLFPEGVISMFSFELELVSEAR